MTTYNLKITGQQSHITTYNLVAESVTKDYVLAVIERRQQDVAAEDYPIKWDGQSHELTNDYYIEIEPNDPIEFLENNGKKVQSVVNGGYVVTSGQSKTMIEDYEGLIKFVNNFKN